MDTQHGERRAETCPVDGNLPRRTRLYAGDTIGPVRSRDALLLEGGAQLRADLLAENVDGDKGVSLTDMPKRPAVAGRRTLNEGTDLMDRPTVIR